MIRFNFALLLGMSFTSVLLADDWPHWMGPQRDNIWREDNLIDSFPDDGPKIVWSAKVAGGYAGPAVAGGRVYVTDYVTADNVKVANFKREKFSGVERILCLDEATGKQIWEHKYSVTYGISYPAGPRCTPIVEDNRVYTLGAEGHLVCLAAKTGDVVWSRHLPGEYKTKAALWGYAAHPLLDGGKLICLAGGEGSHVVALDKKTGKEIWRSLTSPEQGYAPPTIFEFAGKRQLVLLRPDAVSSLDPESGNEYWSVPYEATNGSIIMSPVMTDNYLYAAGYSNRSLLLKLAKDKPAAEVEWRDLRKQAISPVNVQPILVDSVLYGFDQRGDLCAVELPAGKRLWSTSEPLAKRPRQSGTAFIVKQADRFWLFTENGDLIIAKLSRDGYKELDRARVIEPSNVAFGRDVVWAAPAFANRRAYIRSDDKCICVELAKK